MSESISGGRGGVVCRSNTLKDDALATGPDAPLPILRVQVDEKKIPRKIDIRVLPVLFTIYIASFLDR